MSKLNRGKFKEITPYAPVGVLIKESDAKEDHNNVMRTIISMN